MPSLDSELNAANRRFTFTGGGLADGTFSVVEMTGFEALSKPFNFELILVSHKVDVNFDDMLSNPATLIICTPDGTPDGKNKTPYHGVLSEFEQLQEVDTLVFYKAVLVPRLQRLSLYRTSDVFLNDQTIPDVLDTVILASGLNSSDYVKMTFGSYRKRNFVCQYQETNFDFISRWMEKEGMYYYFDHSGFKDYLVIVDDVIMLSADVSNVTYRPVEDPTSINASDSIHSFVCRQQPLPKQVILQGFNYAAAKVTLDQLSNKVAMEQSYTVSDTGTGVVMLYGENFLTPEEGSRYAKLRAEQILCNGRVFKGEATATGIRSGHFIQMSGHYRGDFNVQYLVTEIEHSGSQAGVLLAGIAHSFGGKSGETSYRHSFRANPRFMQLDKQFVDMQFRPECKTKRPHIAGTISAIIDAEGSGQYADLDEFGQYKVQLPFSKSGKAANQGSARIRMATPYAGSNHGMHFPLHKGAEVLLSFMDGDPDQPVILGAVPNSENPSVVKLANAFQNKINTAGGNNITLADTTGKQTVSIYTPGYNTWLTMGAAENKVAVALFPAVSYRVSTAGSMNMFAGGSSVGASRGRSYVNLQGDDSFTLLGTSKMAWQGFFDLSFRSDTSYRQDRISIDRLDNYARANNIIQHAEDTVTISAGRKDDEVEKIKKLTDRASLISKMKLALTTAIAVKDVIMVAIVKEKEDVTKQPGITKTLLSPAFLALNLAYSFYMQDLTGDIKKQKKDTFNSNLVIGPGGLNMSAGAASVSITRAEKYSPELPDGASFFSLAGVTNAVKNYAIGKPDPKPVGRGETKLEISSKVGIEGHHSCISNNEDQILLKTTANTAGGYFNEMKLDQESALISIKPSDGAISLNYGKGIGRVDAKVNISNEGIVNSYTSSGIYESKLALEKFIQAEVLTSFSGDLLNKSRMELSDNEVVLEYIANKPISGHSKLLLNKFESSLEVGEVKLTVAKYGVSINANGKLIKLG